MSATPTPFSGSKAALPIWTNFTLAVRPAGGYSRFTPPAGIRVVLIDPASGQLATDRCPQVLSEAFPAGRIPAEVCYLHGGRFELPLDPEVRAEREQERREGREWMDIGTGDWDRQRRPSEVRLDRLLRLDPARVRREGSALPKAVFDEVLGAAQPYM